METLKPFDPAETSMREKLDRLFELRSATVELKTKLAEIRQAGNELFDQFQDEFKSSLEVTKTPRPAKKKLKSAPAGN